MGIHPYTFGCMHSLLSKLISTYEVEKAGSHQMELIKPEETNAEITVGQRCIFFNKIDPTVPKEITISFIKQSKYC